MRIFNSQFTIKGRGKWCSRECRYPKKVKITCPACKKSRLTQPSRLRRGTKYCNRKCKADYYKLAMKGDKNPSWRGGVTKKGHALRTCDRYIEFRVKILIRDNGECTQCGSRKQLEVHHKREVWRLLKDFEETGRVFNPEDDFFYDEDNLVTLCKKCHVKLKV